MSTAPEPGKARRAFALIEIVAALGLCAFVLIALLGLLQTSLRTHLDSQEESLAVNLSELVVRDMRQGAQTPPATPAGPEVSPVFAIPLQAGASGKCYLSGDGRLLAAASDSDARFRIVTAVSDDARRIHLAFYPAHTPSPVPVLEVVTNLQEYGKL